ncbi:MAG: hypothetical protein AAGF11_51775 [Myxococcota bacterium]
MPPAPTRAGAPRVDVALMLIDHTIYLDGGEFLLASPPWIDHLDYTPLSVTESRLQVRRWSDHGRPATIARLQDALGLERSFDRVADTKRCCEILLERLSRPNANLVLYRRNRMVLVLDQSPRRTMVDLAALASPEPPTPSPPLSNDEQTDHWIELQLVDAQGCPIAEQPCEVRLPDGRTIEDRTDHVGMLRIDQISDPGQCQVSFPSLYVTRMTGSRG